LKIFEKIKESRVFIFCLFIFLFPIPSRIFPHETGDNTNDYHKLFNLYQEYFKIEEDLFARLTFKLSDEQLVMRGSSFKLTLEDNLGRKWIFKDKGTNRVIAHRIYALFGIQNPEIHKMRLQLNGKIIQGTLQKFVPSQFSLSNYKPASISKRSLDYIMKAQVADWIMRDHDANMLNFLVLSFDKENMLDGLMRIDQDCACLDSEYSDLDYVHMVAIDKNLNRQPQGNYYYAIQKSYKKKEIDLDFKKAYAFVKFIADFPEELLEGVILPLKAPGNNSLTKEDFDRLKKKHSFLWGSLVSNKRNMSEDFKNLYVSLADSLNETIELPGNATTNQDLAKASDNFEKGIGLLLEAKSRFKNKTNENMPKINAQASLEGFYVMRKIYEVCWYKKGNLPEECREALKKLVRLKSGAHANEKKAIDVYVLEVKKILAGKGMTFPINQINKLVDPVLPTGK
jgi:hypothetical protein